MGHEDSDKTGKNAEADVLCIALEKDIAEFANCEGAEQEHDCCTYVCLHLEKYLDRGYEVYFRCSKGLFFVVYPHTHQQLFRTHLHHYKHGVGY